MPPLIRTKVAIFTRHLLQATVACLTAMTQGNFGAMAMGHWKVALITGVLAGTLGVTLSFTSLFRHYRPWVAFALSSFLATLLADRLSHPTHYGPTWTEALVTATGAGLVSLLISLAPVAAAVERLERPDFHR